MNISVVITTYNNENTIFECITSVMNQTVTPKEIIAVDDAGLDDTANIIRDKFPNVKLCLLKQSMGFSYSVNTGLKHISDDVEYVLIMQGGSIPDKNWIRNSIKFLEGKKHIFSVCGVVNIDKDSYIGMKPAIDGQISLIKNVSYKTLLIPNDAIVLIKRDVLQALGHFNELYTNSYSMADMGIRAVIRGYKNYYCPKAVSKYTSGDNFGFMPYEIKDMLLFRYINFPLFARMIYSVPYAIKKMIKRKINKNRGLLPQYKIGYREFKLLKANKKSPLRRFTNLEDITKIRSTFMGTIRFIFMMTR